jgi:DNA-binding Lrp family transcriptional regulator
MVLAFILLNVELGQEPNVAKELEKISEVTQSYLVYGVYDIIARVKAENMNELKELISSKIRRLEDVRTTLTLITSE